VDSPGELNSLSLSWNIRSFEVKNPAKPLQSDSINLKLRHHFGLPKIEGIRKILFESNLWVISTISKGNHLYEMFSHRRKENPDIAAIFNNDYSEGDIYTNPSALFLRNRSTHSLTFFTTDQVLLVPFLSLRQGIVLHGCGIIMDGQGYIFVGHSGAGKSTIAKMFVNRAKIICDDRVIVRKIGGRFFVYGTWCHGDLPFVSPEGAELKGIFFLNKDSVNSLKPCPPGEVSPKLFNLKVSALLDPLFVNSDFELCVEIARSVPSFCLNFRKDYSIFRFLDSAFKGDLSDLQDSLKARAEFSEKSFL
jgi:hypothetical protein